MGNGTDVSKSNVTSIAHLKGKVDETGQQVTIQAPRRRKRRKGWRDRVGLVDMDVMVKLELTGLDYRVLFGLMSFIPEKGGCDAYCTQRELADKLGIHQPTVSKILKQFQERYIATRVRSGRWHVNAWIVYNGDFDSWNMEAEIDPEPIWVRDVNTTTGEVR